MAAVATAANKRPKGKSVRLYQDQIEAAAKWGAAQSPPLREEEVLRWWVDLGRAVEAKRKKR